MRYQVKTDDVGHTCCYEAEVVDTESPWTSGGADYRRVCECHNVATAQMIADALNADPSSNDLLQNICRAMAAAVVMNNFGSKLWLHDKLDATEAAAELIYRFAKQKLERQRGPSS